MANVKPSVGLTDFGKLKKSLNTESNPAIKTEPSSYALYKKKSAIANGQYLNYNLKNAHDLDELQFKKEMANKGIQVIDLSKKIDDITQIDSGVASPS